jgi:N-methylhydantoinase B
LTIDFAGTAAQAPGAVNCTRAATEGAVLGVFLTMFCFDLPWSVGALRRVLTILTEPATINDAASPAAVSMASVAAMLSTSDAVMAAYGKMLMSSSEMFSEAQAGWSPGANITVIGGTRQDGRPFTHMFLDSAAGGGGARTFGDGIDTGGGFASMSFAIPNVETSENRAPVLQLFRRECCDSCGHGRWRGGAGVQFAIVPHKAAAPITTVLVACGVSQPGGPGLSGGSPASVKSNIVYRHSDIRRRFADGLAPDDDQAWQANTVETREAKDFMVLGEDDILVALVCGGGGFGDPLRRDAELVARDVRHGLVSPPIARSIYGVALNGDALDAAGTARARDGIRAQRLREAQPATAAATEHRLVEGGQVVARVADTIEVVQADGERALRCTECHHRFGDYDCDYKAASLLRELPLTALSALNATGLIDDVVLREFCCPGCGTAVAMDVQQRSDALIEESRLIARDP